MRAGRSGRRGLRARGRGHRGGVTEGAAAEGERGSRETRGR